MILLFNNSLMKFASRVVRFILVTSFAAILMLQFTSSAAMAQSPDQGKYRYEIYNCKAKNASEIQKQLQPLLVDSRNRVQVVADASANQILIHGNSEHHAKASKLIAILDQKANTAPTVPTVIKSPTNSLDQFGQPAIKPNVSSPGQNNFRPQTQFQPRIQQQPTENFNQRVSPSKALPQDQTAQDRTVLSYPVPAEQIELISAVLREKFAGRGVTISADKELQKVFAYADPISQARIKDYIAKLVRLTEKNRNKQQAIAQSSPDLSSKQKNAAITNPASVSNPFVQNPIIAPRTTGVAGNTQQRSNLQQTKPQQFPITSQTASEGLPRMQSALATEWDVVAISTDAGLIRNKIVNLLEKRVRLIQQGAQATYVVAGKNNETLLFRVNPSDSTILLKGNEKLLTQMRWLIKSLDGNTGNARVKIISLQQTDEAKLRQAADAYKPNKRLVPQYLNGSAIPRPNAMRLVKYTFQDPIDLPNNQNSLDDNTKSKLKDLGENVEIQSLPDLDIIILRGRDKEVVELEKIIQELERISEETEPEIELYMLKHANGESIKEIIDAVESELTGARQGRVQVTPIVKPNSLLLIGWGDAVLATKELITKLDQPVDPQTQFRVFQLQFAIASEIEDQIDDFLGNREPLGPRVQLISDDRVNMLVAYAAPRDMMEVQRLVSELDKEGMKIVNQVRVFPVLNSLANDLADTLTTAIEAARSGNDQQDAVLELLAVDEKGKQILSSGILNEVTVTPDSRKNTLVVTAPAESMQLLEALIRQLDASNSTALIRVFRIKNGSAASLIQMLRSLLPSSQGADPTTRLPGAENGSLAPLRFSLDTRSNSIIATGSESDLEIIEALLLRLDQKDSSQRQNTVYRLKNSPAVDVAQAINNFLISKRQLQNASPGEENPYEQIEKEVVVVPEPIGNKLILSATPKYFDEIRELIEKLDESPPQVMIQVLIAEVALNDTDEFGVELGVQDSILFDRSLLGDLQNTIVTESISTAAGVVTTTQEIIQAATNNPGFNFNNQPLGNSGANQATQNANVVGAQGLTNFSVGRLNNELGYGGLVLSASSESLSVLVRALQESRRLEVLSRPQVRTLDNQPAFIQVGQRVPRIVSSSINQNVTQNTVALENVGLILGVTPRISPDGTVVMEIDAEKSDLGPEEDGVPVSVSADGSVVRAPRIDTTTAQATVSAASGETIILGGLITKTTQDVHRRVPFLSDIPLLGNLFRYDGVTGRRTELIIILTPHVIRSQQDSERIKQLELARMSWCAADVYDLHGDVGYVFQDGMIHDHANTKVVYPDAPSYDGQPMNSGRPNQLPTNTEIFEPELAPNEFIQQQSYEAPVESKRGMFNLKNFKPPKLTPRNFKFPKPKLFNPFKTKENDLPPPPAVPAIHLRAQQTATDAITDSTKKPYIEESRLTEPFNPVLTR